MSNEKKDWMKILRELRNNIGNTPLVDFSVFSKNPEVKIFTKTEWNQLSGSVKARAAYGIIKGAIEREELTPGKSILDASSGNTAIAYAEIGNKLGIPVTIVLPENASSERKIILESLGVSVIYSSPFEGTDGAQVRAKELASSGQYYYADQYNNEDNWKIHFETTGPEILTELGNEITHFASGLGTCGTFVGVGKFLKKSIPAIKIVQLQPDSPMHGLEGWKHLETAKVPGIYDATIGDENRWIHSQKAIQLIPEVERHMNLQLSPSSAASLLGCIQLSEEIRRGCIVTTLADDGKKYSEVYEELEMNYQKMEL